MPTSTSISEPYASETTQVIDVNSETVQSYINLFRGADTESIISSIQDKLVDISKAESQIASFTEKFSSGWEWSKEDRGRVEFSREVIRRAEMVIKESRAVIEGLGRLLEGRMEIGDAEMGDAEVGVGMEMDTGEGPGPVVDSGTGAETQTEMEITDPWPALGQGGEISGPVAKEETKMETAMESGRR